MTTERVDASEKSGAHIGFRQSDSAAFRPAAGTVCTAPNDSAFPLDPAEGMAAFPADQHS